MICLFYFCLDLPESMFEIKIYNGLLDSPPPQDHEIGLVLKKQPFCFSIFEAVPPMTIKLLIFWLIFLIFFIIFNRKLDKQNAEIVRNIRT